jgi:hypothetical protein
MLLFFTTVAVYLTVLAQNYIQINNKDILVGAGGSKINVNQSSTFDTQHRISLQQQKTAINIDINNLSSPCILSITPAGYTQLVGKISVNGVVIQNLNKNQASVNLSPLLSTGINYIEISGNYKPAQDSVRIEFAGPGTKVTQETGGNGILRQTLIIAVQ